MIKPEDVTIIIPHLGATLEQTESLIECLISLEDTFTGPLIVASNGNNVAAREMTRYTGLLSKRQQLSTIHIDLQGQCKAVNAAAATVNTPWIFVTNDDMVYAPGWWERLTEGITDELCISPQLVEPREGAPTFLVEFCGGAGGDFDKAKWLDYAKKMSLDSWSFDNRKGFRTGFNLPFLIKRDLWDTVGGYDINYDPWGSNSDSDLEYQIRLAGVQPYQNTNCLVYHFSQTSGTFEPRNNEYYQRNFQVFRDKWGFDRTDNGIWEANFKMPEAKSRGGERIFEPEWEGKYGPV